MDAFIIYLLKSAGLLVFFVTMYALLMQGETFHKLNRFLLIAIVMLSIIVPTINIGIETPLWKLYTLERNKEEAIATTEFDILFFNGNEDATETDAPTKSTITLYECITIVYLLGVLFFTIRLIIMYMRLINIIRKGEKADASPYTNENIDLRIAHKEIKPFSWFNFVMVDKSDMQNGLKEIITHEAAHSRALHSIDIILLDTIILLQWFNPMVWLAKKWLKNIHEYEADEAVIKSGINVANYQQLIIKKAVGSSLYSIANSFNHSSTLKRITMMCKEKSNMWRCAKALYIIPTTAIAAVLFSQPEEAKATQPENIGEVTNLVPKQQGVDKILTPEEKTSTSDIIKADVKIIPDDADKGYMKVAVSVPDSALELDKKPEFPGGYKAMQTYLSKSIRYPKEARENNIQGKVLVKFIVKADGSVDNVEIEKSSKNELLDTEAIRVVKNMPKWTPGEHEGKAVNTKFTLPIMFKLSIGTKPSTKNNVDSNGHNDNATSKDNVLQKIDKQPEFPGGYKAMQTYLSKSIRYPKEARENNIQGKVLVKFIVKADGSVDNVEIEKSSKNELLDTEAIRVVKNMPKWTPGEHEGKAVNTKFILPVNFRLSPAAGGQPKKANVRATQTPLMVVDGNLINETNVTAFRTKDIESINVIQGETATNIYGERAAAGVIDIKTKVTEAPSPDDVFALTEYMPQFPGGNTAFNKFFTEKIKIESTVNGERINEERFALLYFIVEKDGSISNVDIVESKGIKFKEPIIELAKNMPNWEPGKHNGEPVRVRMQEVVRFN